MGDQPKKQTTHYLSLQGSEMSVAESASRIFAAYLTQGVVNDENKGRYYRIAVQDALNIAMICEQAIESDHEVAPADGQLGIDQSF